MLSIIIPSRNEKYLAKTVDDIFLKARGAFEVIVICDEQMQELQTRTNLYVCPKKGKPGLRSAMNQAIELATGKYIMKTDGHCMFGEGFDEILTADMEDNWVVIPRRYSLIPESWEINYKRPIVDGEYYVFPWVPEITSVKTGGKWYQRWIDHKELLIDETLAFQGSCWLTTKEHLKNIDGFGVETSTGEQFVLESEELANKTWLSGGKCMINKKTWYAHWHKGSAGRGYFINKWPIRNQRIFHTDYWMHDKWPKAIHTMEWLIERFMPIPGWPLDWKDPKWEQQYIKNNELDPEGYGLPRTY
jgi:glycosyltransferase involved in cell wall biosynthesis